LTRTLPRVLVAIAAGVLLLLSCSPGVSPPGSIGPSRSPQASTSVVPSGTESPDETTYTVQAGDTLSSIASAWGTSVGQLQAWNAAAYPPLLVDANALQAGWMAGASCS